MYKLEFTASALNDFGYFKKAEQSYVLDNIEASLRHESLAETAPKTATPERFIGLGVARR